jgi:hypothetical protein
MTAEQAEMILAMTVGQWKITHSGNASGRDSGPSEEIMHQAEKQACRVFPDPQADGLASGVKRNFQILPPLDFLAEFTPHIPAKGSHLIRGHGFVAVAG